jgi:hypothetical protein
MISHFALMALFAAFVSLVFAVIAKDDPREQWRAGVRFFGAFLGAGLLVGWLMYPLPF